MTYSRQVTHEWRKASWPQRSCRGCASTSLLWARHLLLARDLAKILDADGEQKRTIPILQRGPSSAAMHLGHLVPFLMCHALQAALRPETLVVQMTDDEFLWKGEYDEKKGYDLNRFRALISGENAKDIIACGFDLDKTFIFSDCDYMGHMYPNVVEAWKSITYSTAGGLRF